MGAEPYLPKVKTSGVLRRVFYHLSDELIYNILLSLKLVNSLLITWSFQQERTFLQEFMPTAMTWQQCHFWNYKVVHLGRIVYFIMEVTTGKYPHKVNACHVIAHFLDNEMIQRGESVGPMACDVTKFAFLLQWTSKVGKQVYQPAFPSWDGETVGIVWDMLGRCPSLNTRENKMIYFVYASSGGCLINSAAKHLLDGAQGWPLARVSQ